MPLPSTLYPTVRRGIYVALACVAFSALFATCGPRKVEPSLFPTTAECATAADGTGSPPPLTGPVRVAQYLDISAPVAGFLEPAGQPRTPRGIRNFLAQTGAVLQEAVPSATLSSWNFAKGIIPVQNTAFAAPKFSGEGSDIRDPIAQIQAELTAGSLSAAIVVTDLVGTCDTLGASCAAPAMVSWLKSDFIKSGFAVGLLGVKAPYFGVKNRVCPGVGGVGCRFSENRSAWVPIDAPVETPLYALVFARDGKTLARILAGLSSALDPDGTASRVEDFTVGRSAVTKSLTCDMVTTPQTPVWWVTPRDGMYWCNRTEPFDLACKWASSDTVLPLKATVIDPQWNQLVSVKPSSKGELTLQLSCEELQKEPSPKLPRAPLALSFPLTESVTRIEWGDWSVANDSEPDAAGKTLRLAPLIELLRSAASRPVRTLRCDGVAPSRWQSPKPPGVK